MIAAAAVKEPFVVVHKQRDLPCFLPRARELYYPLATQAEIGSNLECFAVHPVVEGLVVLG